MTKQDKELLLKDLSARLPYGVKANVANQIDINIDGIIGDIIFSDNGDNGYSLNEYSIKPYLRPMSSMTEKEYDEWLAVSNDDGWGARVMAIAVIP